MKTKGGWGKPAIICFALVMVLGLTGIGYAASTGGGSGGVGSAVFSWAVSNDDGSPTNAGGFSPIDPGDFGSDPHEGQSPAHLCARFADYDVASTTISGANTATLAVTLNNVYPGYHPTIFFGLRNNETTPGASLGKITQIVLNTPGNYLDVSVQGVMVNQYVAGGTEAVGSVEMQLKDSESRGQPPYTTTVTIVMSQATTP